MSKRHDTIGIKQAIRYGSMEKTVKLLLAGLDAKAMRRELHDFLANSKSDAVEGELSDQSRTFAVNNLMRIWVAPDPDLIAFRNAALSMLRDHPLRAPQLHWAMISAAYPFWFNVARQTGRLLNLQDQVTRQQIVNRLKEHYGDRQTISRYSRYVIRSFVDWGVLIDTQSKGCYEKTSVLVVLDKSLTVLLLEAALYASSEGVGLLGSVVHAPSFFPFKIPEITGDLIQQLNPRIGVVRYGLDDELLSLRKSIPGQD